MEAKTKTTPKSRAMLEGAEVQRRTGYSRVHRWRLVRRGEFPAPVVLGANKVGWYEDEIEAWLSARPRASYAESA